MGAKPKPHQRSERGDYFFPPHGGRPPSDEAVRESTRRYVEEERQRIQKRNGVVPGEGTKEKV